MIKYVIAIVLCLSACGTAARGQGDTGIKICGDSLSAGPVSDLVAAFNARRRATAARFSDVHNLAVSEHLAKGFADVAAHHDWWSPRDEVNLRALGGTRKMKAYPLGALAVCVVVSKTNTVRAIPVRFLEDIYRGNVRDWGQVAGSAQKGEIHALALYPSNVARMIFKSKILHGHAFAQVLRVGPKESPYIKRTAESVLAAVASDTSAIGFIPYVRGRTLPKNVRILPVIASVWQKREITMPPRVRLWKPRKPAKPRIPRQGGRKPPRKKIVLPPPPSLKGLLPTKLTGWVKEPTSLIPSPETIFNGTYPLMDTLSLFVRPDAPPSAREFCAFAINSSNAGLLRKHGLLPEVDRLAFHAKRRLKEAAAKRSTARKAVPESAQGDVAGKPSRPATAP